MKRQTLMRLCLALFLLAATLGIVSMADRSADAAPCCTWCDATYEGCLTGMYYPECGGSSACCDQKTAGCYSHCNNAC
jgi:hypothetical protein